jgi:simple sugar transport system permease protein
MGELMGERTGMFNFGINGMMSLGALTAIIIVNTVTPNPWLGLVGAAVAGLVMAFLFGLVAIYIKTDQFLVGLAFAFLGDGLSGEIGRSYVGQPAQARFLPIEIPFLSDIPILGKGLFSHSILVYVAYFVLPLLAAYIIYKTRHGLSLRAIGQDPAAADVRGIRVDWLRFLYTCLNGILAGIAGASLTLSLSPSWNNSVVAGRGWIAISLVIFSNWNPIFVVFGAILFGAATSIGFIAQVQGWGIPTSLLFMLPYLATLLLMVISALTRKRKGVDMIGIGPAALGLPFHRE